MIPIPIVSLIFMIARCVVVAGLGRFGQGASASHHPKGDMDTDGFDDMVAAVVDAALDVAQEASDEDELARGDIQKDAIRVARGIITHEINGLVAEVAKVAGEVVVSDEKVKRATGKFGAESASHTIGGKTVLHEPGSVWSSKQGSKKNDSRSTFSMPATEVVDLLKDFVVALDEKRNSLKHSAEGSKDAETHLTNVSLKHGFGGSMVDIVNEVVGAARESFNDVKLVAQIKEATNAKISALARYHMKSLSKTTEVDAGMDRAVTSRGGSIAVENVNVANDFPSSSTHGEYSTTAANMTASRKFEEVHHIANVAAKSRLATPRESLLSHGVLGVKRLFEEEEDVQEDENQGADEANLDNELASDQEEMMQRLVSSLGGVVR